MDSDTNSWFNIASLLHAILESILSDKYPQIKLSL